MAPRSTPESAIGRLQRRMAAALGEERPDAFVELCDHDIEFCTYGFGPRELRGHAELLEWWSSMRDATTYRVSVRRVTELSDRAAFIEGRIQFERDGWFTDRQASWVIVERDERAWRYRPMTSLDEAVDYVRGLGAMDEVATAG